MGQLTRQTREELGTWADDPTSGEFGAFLDDVAAGSFAKACEERMLTQGAVLRWLAANDVRAGAYAAALQVKAEILVHESIAIADGPPDDDGKYHGLSKFEVPGAKLRTGLRMQVAGHWNERYRARVQVQHSGEVRVDAGLTVAMGDLLARVVATQNSPPVPDAEVTALPEPLALPGPAGDVERHTVAAYGDDRLIVLNPAEPEREWAI